MILLVSDHAGFDLKQQLLESEFLDQFDDDIIDLNPELDPDDDYPDMAAMVLHLDGYQKARIIGLCGSGQGICMALNKLPGVRAGLAYDTQSAQIIRLDNDANAVCVPSRSHTLKASQEILKVFLSTQFSDQIRHKRRVEKLDKLSNISDN
jgi:ribose 5-phosphate isomerase B